MTDRELLEAAAKAAGYEVKPHPNPLVFPSLPFLLGDKAWNPLTDDGDAFVLASVLGLIVDFSRPSAGLPYQQHVIWLDELCGNEELVRRAIVRAAAEIGKDRS